MSQPRTWYISALLVAALLALLPAGCTPKQYAEQADRSATGAIKQSRSVALGEEQAFQVQYSPFCGEGEDCDSIEIADGKCIPIGSAEPAILTLDECLEVALRNSRTFQDRKESLYSQALAVANGRRAWNWSLFGGDETAAVGRSVTNRGGETNAAAGSFGAGLAQRFAQGGALALGASLTLASDLLGVSSTNVGSLLDANFTQPLLRGAWHDFAYEGQYRAERDLLFAVYEYERFTHDFAASIVRAYYDVLQQRDQLANEAANIERLKETFNLTRVLVDGGERSRIEQDQAEQNLLNAQIRYQQSRQGYQNALDQFKITLGLPIRASMELDYPGALQELQQAGPQGVPVEEDLAVQVAMSVRPDVLIEAAKVRDGARNVDLAADAFLPLLDLGLGINAAGTDPRSPGRVQVHRNNRRAGIVLDYDLDQTNNRDAYRNTMIAYEKVRRDYVEFEDRVRLQVRQAYRELMQSRNTYELQVRNVDIAKRRRMLASLQQKQGEASARDVLEAEEQLRQAQNGLTSALVSYTTTRLEFMATLGMIGVDERGRIYERTEPYGFGRIQQHYPYVAKPAIQ